MRDFNICFKYTGFAPQPLIDFQDGLYHSCKDFMSEYTRTEDSLEQRHPGVDRRTFLKASAATILGFAGLGVAGYGIDRVRQPQEHEQSLETFISEAGESLIAMHEVDPDSGGWKFKSAIQAPHFQTDRDVGASGIGIGFLRLAEALPSQNKWVDAASKTADWLTAVSKSDGRGGRYWNDYTDKEESSPSTYTSFDDGTIGVGDFYWQLYEKTEDTLHKHIALECVAWTLSQAEEVPSTDGPMYQWAWDTSTESDYYLGMGMGQVGIVNTLVEFADRIGKSDPELSATYERYIDGAVRYIDSMLIQSGTGAALPETAADPGSLNSGYLSGAAGAAYMYLNLYRQTNVLHYRTQAERLLDWLEDEDDGALVRHTNSTSSWKILVSTEDEGDSQYATGFEEGAAGIGWTFLQAYEVTGDDRYLQRAQSAADWLISVGKHSNTGTYWYEDEHSSKQVVHANLNNGAAGIGQFLYDIHSATGEQKYLNAAQSALQWIRNTAKTGPNGMHWSDNDGEQDYFQDPSWHWGNAGIIGAAIRMNGGRADMPGMQPSIK